MINLNSVLIEGNLTSDAELRETPRGTKLCAFSVASNRSYRHNEAMQRETSFFDIELWGKSVPRLSSYLTKGKGVRVMGRLRQDRWEDGEGKRRSRVKIVSDHLEFTGPPKKTEENADGPEEASREVREKEEVLAF